MANTDFYKTLLSGSTDGAGIGISSIVSPGDLIHAAFSNAVAVDRPYLYVANNHTADVTLTLLLGGVAAKDTVKVTLSALAGLNLVVPGLIFRNSLSLRAFASSPNALVVFGEVERASLA